MAESAVVAGCQRLLRRRGAWTINIHGSGIGETGIPDLIACYHGHLVAVETKHPNGGRISAKQAYHLARIQAAGGRAIVARDVATLKLVLDEIDQKERAAA